MIPVSEDFEPLCCLCLLSFMMTCLFIDFFFSFLSLSFGLSFSFELNQQKFFEAWEDFFLGGLPFAFVRHP